MKCNQPFTLIHSDIWELAKILVIHGAMWFVTFIDDCTRTTWLFLMKDKSKVSSLLPQFQKISFTQFEAKIKWFHSNNSKDYLNQNLSSFVYQGRYSS